MMDDGGRIGSPHDRELQYYRRECNDLGARLLRLQEEQSQTYREARRSRMVVRLVREAYRIGDLAHAAHDVGGSILEVIVDNVLCDGAVLLREEARGGRFLVAHAIGIADAAVDAAVVIPDPPAFCYVSSCTPATSMSATLSNLLRMPFALWAYDRSSGYALVIANRSENTVSRPFEAADQELAEGALFIYLDVLYRKQAEAQLRQAKQAAEEASQKRATLLSSLSRELLEPLLAVAALSETVASDLASMQELARQRGNALRIARDARHLASIAERAIHRAKSEERAPALDLEWIGLAHIVGGVVRLNRASTAGREVDLAATLPRRAVAVCVDRKRMQTALQALARDALARVVDGASVRIHAARRVDGDVEIIVSTPTGCTPLGSAEAPEEDAGPAAGLEAPRRIIGAHGGTLVLEAHPNGGSQARVILPARIVRDDQLAGLPPL